jgi:MFS transporter, PAT family, beta-lactamase induction signal transducer AmpG
MAASGNVLAAPAGQIAKTVGWPTFFLLTLGAALPGLALLPFFAPWHQPINMPRPGTRD